MAIDIKDCFGKVILSVDAETLRGANLSRADLSGAYHAEEAHGLHSIVPEVGAFEGFKKLRGGLLARLQIPADAVRVGGWTGRKCRASHALVLEIFTADFALLGTGTAMHDGMKYRAGETVVAADFDPDPRLECAGGIHFFLTLKEAQSYGG